MMRNLLFSVCMLFANILLSQDYVNQVLVLNEGYFDYTLNQSIEPVTIGSYDPVLQTYIVVDTIQGARFASDLIIDGDYFYVAADNMIYKYSKVSYALVATESVPGVRNLAVWNDKILATRGDYDNVTFQPILFNSYLQIFNKTDLSFYLEIDTISGPKWATQNLIIQNDKAYIAINNAYEWGNEKGFIGILDMNSFSYINEIDLGPHGKNPDNMMRNGSEIYTINNKDWSGMSISEIDINTGIVNTINQSSISTGCGTSCLRDGRINYQISSDTILYEWNVFLQNNPSPLYGFNKNFYDLAVDTINSLMYASVTDYFSYGYIDIYNDNNILISSFQCGISPGTIAFDIVATSSTSIDNIDRPTIDMTNYDMLGREIHDISNYRGIYIGYGNRIFFK